MKNKFYPMLFIIWTIILFTLTSIPKLSTPTDKMIGLDKLAHFSFYLVFAFLFMKMMSNRSNDRSFRLLCILSIAVPLFDELHQIPIPGRQFSLWDLLADFLGFCTIYLIFKIKKKKEVPA